MSSSMGKLPDAVKSEDNHRPSSPGPQGLRFRGLQRAGTLGDGIAQHELRRSSFMSDTFSETRRSFLSSTDDLILPRPAAKLTQEDNLETTHWHSVPLALALLPAFAGLFFKDGSAVVTDITLLALAAIVMNWALRLPWEWYRAAQSAILTEADTSAVFSPDGSEDVDAATVDARSPEERSEDQDGAQPGQQSSDDLGTLDDQQKSAQAELRVHELMAFSACFLCPVLAAWLLHAIRDQLSRPSEGLVSNYNLTIFLLVAELRPLSHLTKMVQQRTLFLQRKLNARGPAEYSEGEQFPVAKLSARLDELEAHIANSPIVRPGTPSLPSSPENLVAEVSSQATIDVKKTMQPELDALSRAMRRYEKRMTITAIQVEARLQDLESRLKDTVVLAAAAQRSADRQPKNYTATLLNWICAVIVIPGQLLLDILNLPQKLWQHFSKWLKSFLRFPGSSRSVIEEKKPMRITGPRPRISNKKSKAGA